MKKPQRRGPSPSVPIGTLAARAAEALQQERFKEAVELFKLVVRQDPRPEWKAALADAYLGRARALAAKGMFKEAAMVLENTLAADGTCAIRCLYLRCLIRDGQQQKAAAHALSHASRGAAPATERGRRWRSSPRLCWWPCRSARRPAAAGRLRTRGAGSNWRPRRATRWRPGSTAPRPRSWTGSSTRISLRSAFRPVRLLLKGL